MCVSFDLICGNQCKYTGTKVIYTGFTKCYRTIAQTLIYLDLIVKSSNQLSICMIT